jgi:EAL domain-containing protein (putative c-di-GMP-specific phosphodiesterase class I)
MREKEGALTYPGAFLPIAERFHLATRIDRWVVRQAFDWMAQAARSGVDIEMMAINLSGQTLGDSAFHRDIVEMIRRAPFDVRLLCLEITETAAITHLHEARTLIDDVRALGVKVALDDFGAGASSFGYLKSLPVDFLKIDGHFITNLLDDPIDHVAVRCFCEVAKVMGIKTIAEFVEQDAVQDELRMIGIDLVQGYLIHTPEPLADLLSEVAAANRSFMTAEPRNPMTHERAVREVSFDLGNPNRLDLDNTADVLLWADDLSISVERLHEIVDKVGPMRAAIRFYVVAARRASRRVLP